MYRSTPFLKLQFQPVMLNAEYLEEDLLFPDLKI